MNTTGNQLTSIEDFEAVLAKSHERPQLIFKHSTSCPVSFYADREVTKALPEIEGNVDINIVLVIEDRPVSQHIAQALGVNHASPQTILIKNGEAVWDTSHNGIYSNALKKLVA